MRNAFQLAARILCVCVLVSVLCVQRSAAQQTPTQTPTVKQPTEPITQPSSQQPATPPPPPPSPVDQYFTGDGFSATVFYWNSMGHPSMGTGHENTNGEPSNLSSLGDAKRSPSIILSFPAGKHNSIRVSYFRTLGDGNIVSAQPQVIYGTSFLANDYLSNSYSLQNAKISLDYLSLPFPLKGSKLRLKTLWEVQATWIHTTVDAPLRFGDTDAAGNLITTTATGTNWFIYPTFGLGIDYLASKNFRFEARASGFLLPHLSTIWDVEATVNYRFGALELMAGEKAFHFKTAPKHVEFIEGTLSGVFVGLRWYPGFHSH